MYSLLSGLRIVEASSFVASPTAGLYLAQMGAEVVRVDQIGGGPDFHRWPKAANGASLYWENLNRAKKSVALDMGRPEGRELLQALVVATGQFITNFPVNGFLSHGTLAKRRPDLVTVRVMGMADGGPALDYTVNAAVGFPDLTGEGPGPVNHVLPAWDLLTGAYAAFAMLAALHHRNATGAGQEVRIPLSDIAIGSVANLGMLAEMLTTGHNRARLGNTVYGAFGRDFTTADNIRLMIMAITPRQWTGLVKVLDIAAEVTAIEFARGVSFATDEGVRFEHRDLLFPLVEARVANRDFAELKAAFNANGCCYAPYQTMQQAAQDPALVGNNPIFNLPDNPSGERYPAAGAMASIPQLERQPAVAAPRLGQHTDEILESVLGLPFGSIAALHDKGLIAQA